MDISTLFVEKVDIATILLHFCGDFRWISLPNWLIFPPHEDSFYLGGNNNQIPPKATLKAGWIKVVPNKKITVWVKSKQWTWMSTGRQPCPPWIFIHDTNIMCFSQVLVL